uniref:molybdate ABC transporter permease subunit n=1 Tax=Pararhizobium sp. IMCC3301 TaxID=3067904 RepID=UPI0027411D89|nr:molybdate ABC transporter permease subunit [Pararhizobium sp. IMCC3301]
MTAAELSALLLSLKVATLALAVMLPIAVFVAYVLSRKRFRGHGLLNALVFLPLVMPPVVTGYVLLLTFGRNGPVGLVLENLFGVRLAFTWIGAAIAAGVMAFPLMVRPLRQAFDAVDPGLEVAAMTLGAKPFRRWLTVTLPLAAPGLVAGAVLGFAKALGEFGATITFAANIPGETRTLALAIFTELQRPGGEAAAFRLTLISLVIAIAAVVLSEIFVARMARRARPVGEGRHD